MDAWLRMKCHFMLYYLRMKDYEKAEMYCHMMERNLNLHREFERWDAFLNCYTYTDKGKALKIYNSHWKKWLNERCPMSSFNQDKYCLVFFREVAKEIEKDTIKLDYDKTFPLYQEDATYVIADLIEFYYKRAYETAQKFDMRNGTDWFKQELKGLEL